MVSESLEQLQPISAHSNIAIRSTQQISYTVGVMAYNEEANIQRTLTAILEQTSAQTRLAEIIVIASGCTDRTVPIAEEMQKQDSRIRLIVQEKREGKASAINLFLQAAHNPVLVMVGADIIPEKDALEKLCIHFADPDVGMVGARPVPVNDQDTFVGHAVHLLWRLHDRMARRSPKLGEVVAFRNVVSSIPIDTAVDEISIQSCIARQHLRLVYEPASLVYNKGPMTVPDFLKQRRRIHAGHLKVSNQEHYEAPTMKVVPIIRELFASSAASMSTPRQICWTIGTISLEGTARLQGYYDMKRNRSHHIWQAVTTTKVLEDEKRKLRRICNTQSIIVFHVSRADADESDFQREYEERIGLQMLRKLLPIVRRYIRKDDLLSLNGGNTLVAVLTADKTGVEPIAERLKKIMEAQPVPMGKHKLARPVVKYHTVSFAQ